jgi:hypothetical protein
MPEVYASEQTERMIKVARRPRTRFAHRPETGGKESTKEMQEERRKDEGGALDVYLVVPGVDGVVEEEEGGRVVGFATKLCPRGTALVLGRVRLRFRLAWLWLGPCRVSVPFPTTPGFTHTFLLTSVGF